MIGTDICDPKRIEKALKRFGSKFLERIFTSQEIEEINSLAKNKKTFFQKIAGRFAAKEAVAKALGTGIGEKLSFRDFEILRSTNGKPQVKLNTKALKLSQGQGYKNIHLSISHEENLAVAFAIAVVN